MALSHKEEGDLLFAAKLLNYVVDQATDSMMIAQAMYELVGVGEQAAVRIKKRERMTEHQMYGMAAHTSRVSSTAWTDRFYPHFEREQALFKEVGIELYNTHYGNHIASNSAVVLTDIAEKYPLTPWGEEAARRLVLEGAYGFGPMLTEAIEKALAFLEKYPDTKYRTQMYTIIARSYSDELRLSECTKNNDYEKELRQNAIKYYLLAQGESIENNNQEHSSKEVNALKSGECPPYYYYFGD